MPPPSTAAPPPPTTTAAAATSSATRLLALPRRHVSVPPMPLWALSIIVWFAASGVTMQLLQLFDNNSMSTSTTTIGRSLADTYKTDKLFPADLVDSEASDICAGESQCADRAKVDLHYNLKIPSAWWDKAPKSATHYSAVMKALHGKNIWHDPRLADHIKKLGIVAEQRPIGSPIGEDWVHKMLKKHRPKIVLEVGVFHGASSINFARVLEEIGIRGGFVLSMDTWLLDLRFVWGRPEGKAGQTVGYWSNVELAGSSQMYFTFLANCITANVTNRVIPIQTASANGAMALVEHRIRPEFMYLDASHAAPEVFLDFENFYEILAPGGLMVLDDTLPGTPPDAALYALTKRYNLKSTYIFKGTRRQAWVQKPE